MIDLQQFIGLAIAETAGQAQGAVAQIIGRIARARAQGLDQSTIAANIGRELADGTLLSAVLGAAKRTARDAQMSQYVQGMTDQAREALGSDADEQLFMWNAVGTRTCEGCIRRHGRVLTLRQWERKGLPGAGGTVCRSNCRCNLIPVERAAELYNTTPDRLTDVARGPIRARSEQVRREAARRDGGLARSTVIAKLGDFREQASSLAEVPGVSVLDTPSARPFIEAARTGDTSRFENLRPGDKELALELVERAKRRLDRG